MTSRSGVDDYDGGVGGAVDLTGATTAAADTAKPSMTAGSDGDNDGGGDGDDGGEDGVVVVGKVHGMGKASPFSCTVNLANTVVGAGMLGLPHAFSEAGSFVGVLLLILAGVASALSLHLLAVCQQTVGEKPSSFYTIAHAAFPALTSVIDIAVAIKCFGVATSYLIVIGDLMPKAIPG